MWTMKIGTWLRKLLKLYDREVKGLADTMLDMAYASLDEAVKSKLTPAIKRKIRNEVIGDIIVLGINNATDEGKVKITEIVNTTVEKVLNGV